MGPANKIKALRVQGSRSRSGCQTCKLKHVKCDEALPVCGRCSRNQRECCYEDKARLTAPGSKFVVYTTDIPKSPLPVVKIASHDTRALWHFQYRTLEQIGGPFKGELWSIIVPRLIQTDPIVRQAVMALSVLHETYLDHDSVDPSLQDRALTYYRKARQQIIKLDSPDDFFDSILCASIIFSACEGLRGNFTDATQHAVSGLRMIAARDVSASNPNSMITSNQQTLFDIFLDLQSQVMEANDVNFNIVYPGIQEQMLHMPDHFKRPEEAVLHLQVLINQVFDLYQTAEEHHKLVPWIPSQVSLSLQPVYQAVCLKYHTWEHAVSCMTAVMRDGDSRQQDACTLLTIIALSYKMYLYVFVHGEATYDDLIDTNYNILSLIETYLKIQPDTPETDVSDEVSSSSSSSAYKSLPWSFTSYPGVIPILFEIATRTYNPVLSQKAVQLLRCSNRREGVWDGSMVANLVEKVNQIRISGEAIAESHHTGYKFLITDVQLLSERKYMIKSGFKKIQPYSFDSWWLETIGPDEGTTQSQILTIP